MKLVDITKINTITLYDDETLDCMVDGKPYYGFRIPILNQVLLGVFLEKFSGSSIIEVPTYLSEDRLYGYCLFSGMRETLADAVSATLYSIDSCLNRVIEILEHIHKIEQSGYILTRLKLEDFTDVLLDLGSKLWNFQNIYPSAPDAHYLLPNCDRLDLSALRAQRTQALGKLIFELVSGEEYSENTSLREVRRNTPQPLIDVVGELLDGGPLDLEPICERLRRIASSSYHAVQGLPRKHEYFGQRIAHFLQRCDGDSLVSIVNGNEYAMHSLAYDIQAHFKVDCLIDASYSGYKQAIEYCNRHINNGLIVICHANCMDAESIQLLSMVGRKNQFIYIVESIQLDESLPITSMFLFGKEKIELDYSRYGWKVLLKDMYLMSANKLEKLLDLISENFTSIKLADLYLKKLERNNLLYRKSNGFWEVRFEELAQVPFNELISNEASQLLGAIGGIPASVSLNYLRSNAPNGSEALAELIGQLKVRVITRFSESYVVPITVNSECSPVVSPMLLNYFISLEQEQEAGAAVCSNYLELCDFIRPAEINIDKIVLAAKAYQADGVFPIVAAQTARIAVETQNIELVLLCLQYLEYTEKECAEWISLLEGIESLSDYAKCIEHIIDYQKRNDDHEQAVECGALFLKRVGISLPTSISKTKLYRKAALPLIANSLIGPNRFFGMKDQLDVSSANALTVRLIAKSISSAYIVDPLKLGYLALIGIGLCRGKKVSPYMPQIVMVFAVIVGSYAYQYKLAKRLYDYAKDLIERFKLEESAAAVDFYYLSMIKPYIDHAGLSEDLYESFNKALVTDTENASYLSATSIAHGIYQGDEIDNLKAHIQNQYLSIRPFGHATPLRIHVLSEEYIESKVAQRIFQSQQIVPSNDSTSNFTLYAFHLLSAIVRGDEADILRYYDRVKKYEFGVKGFLMVVGLKLYASPYLLSAGKYRNYLGVLFHFILIALKNPDLFGHKLLYVYSQLYKAVGCKTKYIRLMKKAGKQAYRKGEFLDAAIIFDHIRGSIADETMATEYVAHAISCYDRIGYVDRVLQLKRLYQLYIKEDASYALTELAKLCEDLNKESVSHSLIETKIAEITFSEKVSLRIGRAFDDLPREIRDKCEQAIGLHKPLIVAHDDLNVVVSPLSNDSEYLGAIFYWLSKPPSNLASFELIAEIITPHFSLAKERERYKALIKRHNVDRAFFPVIEHEIGQPLGAIYHVANKLKLQTALTKEEASLVLDGALEIYGILDSVVSSEENSQNDKLNIANLSLRDEIAGLVNTGRQLCHTKGLSFSVNCNLADDLWIRTDHVKLRVLLRNLLNNAIKYTEQGGVTVIVDIQPNKDNAIYFSFVVKDTGIGIPPEYIERIFERGFRVDTSATRKAHGMGIGLWQCQKNALLLGGKISVTSIAGQETTFTYSGEFTKARALDQQEYVIPRLQMRVLVVDDDQKFSLPVMVDILRDCGIEPDVAVTDHEALSLIQENDYDIVFTDIEMPGTDGVALAGMIREMGRGALIVAVTSHSKRIYESKIRNSPIDEIFQKPFRKNNLGMILRDYFQLDVLSNQPIPSDENMGSTSSLTPLALAQANEILVEFESAYDRLDGLASELRFDELRHYAHTLLAPLRSMGADALYQTLETIEHSNDPRPLINETLSLQMKGIANNAKALLSSQEPLNKENAIQIFEQLVKDDDPDMIGFYLGNKEQISCEYSARFIAKLEQAVTSGNGIEANRLCNGLQ